MDGNSKKIKRKLVCSFLLVARGGGEEYDMKIKVVVVVRIEINYNILPCLLNEEGTCKTNANKRKFGENGKKTYKTVLLPPNAEDSSHI